MYILYFKLIYFHEIKNGFFGINLNDVDPLSQKHYYEYDGFFNNPLMIFILYGEKYYLTNSYLYYQTIQKNGNIDPLYNIKLIGNIIKILDEYYHNKFFYCFCYEKFFYNDFSPFFRSDSILKKDYKLSHKDLMKISNQIYWDSKKLIYPNAKYHNHEEYILDNEYKEIEKFKNKFAINQIY